MGEGGGGRRRRRKESEKNKNNKRQRECFVNMCDHNMGNRMCECGLICYHRTEDE